MTTNGTSTKSGKINSKHQHHQLDTPSNPRPTSPDDIPKPSTRSADVQQPLPESVRLEDLHLKDAPSNPLKIDEHPDHPQVQALNPTSDSATVPSDSQLLDSVVEIRTQAPTLGVLKLLIKLKELNPGWQLSEKRLRKFLNNPNIFPTRSNGVDHNDRSSSNPSATSRSPCEPIWLPNYAWEKDWEAASAENSPSEPISSLDDVLLLECRQRSVKIEPVRFTASNKGSGLIAKDHILRGTQIMKEDAFVWVPPSKSVYVCLSSP